MATDPIDVDLSPAVDPVPQEDRAELNAKAERCRRLAAGVSDRQAAEVLNLMARNYQEAADRMAGRD